MLPAEQTNQFTFPKWTKAILPALAALVLGLPIYLSALIGYGGGPATLAVGYQPAQPVPYSHEIHVGQLGMDCRYCHTTVDKAPFAAIPPTQTCWNCHNDTSGIKRDSTQLKPVLDSHASGQPIRWVKVHNLADYVYFNHSRHVNSGVSCMECHGRVDKMTADTLTNQGVWQVAPLSMAWCLECHRSPDSHLRPQEQVYSLAWGADLTAEKKLEIGTKIRQERHINPPTDCWTCHR